jgi:hypothetical protein
MAFIGGNLDDIERSAARLADSGALARSVGGDAHAAVLVLSDAVEDAMTRLLSNFEATADTLTSEIAQSHAVLTGSDWHGRSRDNAVVAKEQLQAQVNSVLGTATADLASEKTAFITRAQVLVERVHTEFQRVMGEVENEYLALAEASRRTRDNLELADQTIVTP